MGRRRSLIAASIAGAAVGLLGGMFGLGGAEFRLPLLIGLFGFAALQAVIINRATSLAVVITALPARLVAVPYLAGHVDWNHEKGAFYDLHTLEPGDEVIVDRADGSAASFQVLRVAQYPKDNFPTQEVYGDVEGAELRLIMCGGELDRKARSYRDNIVTPAWSH